MLGRLLIGIAKGLIVGFSLGFGLFKVGMAVPIPILAYVAAAVTGVVVGLIAGKPIWAKDAKVEAGTKAVIGALLAAGLMAAARTWLMIPIPIPLGTLAPEGATIGGFAITALAAIGALLGGFYEADNNPAEATPAPGARVAAKAAPKRIAAQRAAGDEADELDAETDKKRSRK